MNYEQIREEIEQIVETAAREKKSLGIYSMDTSY